MPVTIASRMPFIDGQEQADGHVVAMDAEQYHDHLSRGLGCKHGSGETWAGRRMSRPSRLLSSHTARADRLPVAHE